MQIFTCKQNFVQYFIQTALRKEFIINFAILSWVDPYELISSIVLLHSLQYNVSKLNETTLSQQLVQVIIVIIVLVFHSVNEILDLWIVNEILYPNFTVTRLGQWDWTRHRRVITI